MVLFASPSEVDGFRMPHCDRPLLWA